MGLRHHRLPQKQVTPRVRIRWECGWRFAIRQQAGVRKYPKNKHHTTFVVIADAKLKWVGGAEPLPETWDRAYRLMKLMRGSDVKPEVQGLDGSNGRVPRVKPDSVRDVEDGEGE